MAVVKTTTLYVLHSSSTADYTCVQRTTSGPATTSYNKQPPQQHRLQANSISNTFLGISFLSASSSHCLFLSLLAFLFSERGILLLPGCCC